MTEAPNAAAPHHMPWFMTAPGETDGLLVGMLIFLIVVIVMLGNFYFHLHAIPEHRAHRTNKAQMEIVCILALLAMFTHNHLYWIAGLLLAFVQLPDFSTPLNSISESLEGLAGQGGLPPLEPQREDEPAGKAQHHGHSPALPQDARPAQQPAVGAV